MPGRELALRHREVDDVVRAADIASGVDVRLRCLLPAVHADAPGRRQFHLSGGQIQLVGEGFAAQRIDQMPRSDGALAPGV